MKKQLIATSIILSMAMSPVMAASTTPENESDNTSEIIGLGTGAVIGGLIAGPIGLVVAGTIGLFIGHSQEQKDQIEQVESSLVQNKIDIKSLNHDKQSLQERLAQSEQTQQLLSQELALTEKTLTQADKLAQLKLNLRFDIDSTQVESFYIPQVKHLAMMMQENPELSVNLSGYADPSGTSESNLQLSQARIESVKLMLVNNGVDEQFIITEAFGESHSMQANRTENSDFNERRVDVQLFAPEQRLEEQQEVVEEQQKTIEGQQEIVAEQVITHEQVWVATQIVAEAN